MRNLSVFFYRSLLYFISNSFLPENQLWRSKNEISDMNYESKVTLGYIELPLNLLYKPEMQKLRFFVGLGPSIAYALSGKEKEKDNGVNTTYTYKFGNNPDEHDLKALDFGANFLTVLKLRVGSW